MASSDTSKDNLSKNEASGQPVVQPSANSTTNLCVICSLRQRAVVFIPCGHFAVCVPCGHGLKTCPTCGSNVTALLRIFSWSYRCIAERTDFCMNFIRFGFSFVFYSKVPSENDDRINSREHKVSDLINQSNNTISLPPNHFILFISTFMIIHCFEKLVLISYIRIIFFNQDYWEHIIQLCFFCSDAPIWSDTIWYIPSSMKYCHRIN
jgi:hypothetical protein